MYVEKCNTTRSKDNNLSGTPKCCVKYQLTFFNLYRLYYNIICVYMRVYIIYPPRRVKSRSKKLTFISSQNLTTFHEP